MLKRRIVTPVLVLFCTMSWVASAVTNDILLDWTKYSGVSCSDSAIHNWHTEGTDRLCNDSDGSGSDDVFVDAILDDTLIDSGWTCTGGTATVTDWDELDDMSVELEVDDYHACVVTSIVIDSNGFEGVSYPADETIFIKATADDGTLVHEVGHLAGLDDVDDSGTENRIMYWMAGGDCEEVIESCPTNGDEKDAYETY